MDKDLWNDCEHAVAELGISVTYKGYYYLIYAIVISIETGLRKASLTKEVYEKIATLNCVSKESVEKCIRNSIDKAWDRDRSRLLILCSDSGHRPTNGQVISLISNRIRLERSTGIC